MSLFIARHRHEPERCPAQDPYAGAMLLNHLSRSAAHEQGVEIRGEAVVQGEHTIYMIIEAAEEGRVRALLEPFAQAGSLDVYPASTCARVVASGGCAGSLIAPGGEHPAVDPEEACARAIEAGLVVRRAHPLNCETASPALIAAATMPSAHFYVRNHFHIPLVDPSTFTLTVKGAVERPLRLDLRELKNLPAKSQLVTLECAGNGRSTLRPPVDGEQWQLGAASTAEWTGVPLAEVLDRAGMAPSAREVLFHGADAGPARGRSGTIHFERSLAIDVARDPDVLLAYAMNGEPLPVQHGFPLRLVVPGWYAVASVKWLTEIEVLDRPFEGHFQTEAYFYEREGQVVREPVTLQRVRSLVTEPAAGAEVPRGPLAIRGVAWSGAAPIARVEVSLERGPWQDARLVGARARHAWQWWELLTQLDRPGPVTVRARATDLAGRTQPEEPDWNRLGYGNNLIHEVAFRAGD